MVRVIQIIMKTIHRLLATIETGYNFCHNDAIIIRVIRLFIKHTQTHKMRFNHFIIYYFNSRYRQYVKYTRMSLSRFVSDALWDSLVTRSLPVTVAGTLADAACVRAFTLASVHGYSTGHK